MRWWSAHAIAPSEPRGCIHARESHATSHWFVWVDSWPLAADGRSWAWRRCAGRRSGWPLAAGNSMATTHNPSDPGEVLRAWLAGITVANPAAWLDVTRVALSHVFNGAAGIIPDMDLRLAATLNTTPDKLVRHAKRLRHVAGAKIIPRYGSPHHVAIGGQLTDCRMTLHAGEFQKLRYNNKGAGSFAALRLINEPALFSQH